MGNVQDIQRQRSHNAAKHQVHNLAAAEAAKLPQNQKVFFFF